MMRASGGVVKISCAHAEELQKVLLSWTIRDEFLASGTTHLECLRHMPRLQLGKE
jgi:hypothetical protein